MVKENNMKLVNPSPTVKDIPNKASSTTLPSIVISIVVIAAISLIGVTFAYALGHHFSNIPTSLDSSGICASEKLAFEQNGYYNNLEEYSAILSSSSK